jgi:hypothetical protein
MAEPEKSSSDYLYLNSSKINNKGDVDGLRLNPIALETLIRNKLDEYLLLFNSKN